jgi:hypothetical protein
MDRENSTELRGLLHSLMRFRASTRLSSLMCDPEPTNKSTDAFMDVNIAGIMVCLPALLILRTGFDLLHASERKGATSNKVT